MAMTMLAQKVRERPIIFGAESVRAILEGRKTQTRRVVSLLPSWKAHGLTHADLEASGFWNCWRGGGGKLKPGEPTHQWQYGDEKLRENYQVGQRLWVREGWRPIVSGKLSESGPDADGYLRYGVAYRADGATVWNERETRVTVMGGTPSGFLQFSPFDKWASPIHMSRDRSRITLELTEVRVEPLQDITGNDAREEGVCLIDDPEPRSGLYRIGQYREAWDSLNAKRGFGWDKNPWVWVLTFKRVQPDTRA